MFVFVSDEYGLYVYQFNRITGKLFPAAGTLAARHATPLGEN
jgi:hypothetical protein